MTGINPHIHLLHSLVFFTMSQNHSLTPFSDADHDVCLKWDSVLENPVITDREKTQNNLSLLEQIIDPELDEFLERFKHKEGIEMPK